MKVLVTGGAGFIGSNLCEALRGVQKFHNIRDLSCRNKLNFSSLLFRLYLYLLVGGRL